MIVGIAEKQALRMAFPEDLASMYDIDEVAVMDSAEIEQQITDGMPKRLSDGKEDGDDSGSDGVGADKQDSEGGGDDPPAPEPSTAPKAKARSRKKAAKKTEPEPPATESPPKEEIVSTDHEVVDDEAQEPTESTEKPDVRNVEEPVPDEADAQGWSDKIHALVKEHVTDLSIQEQMNFMGTVVTLAGDVAKLKEVSDVLRKRLDD